MMGINYTLLTILGAILLAQKISIAQDTTEITKNSTIQAQETSIDNNSTTTINSNNNSTEQSPSARSESRTGNGTGVFQKRTKDCKDAKLLSEVSFKQIMEELDKSEYCNPQELQICDPKTEKCDCGLVNARFDKTSQKCVGLAGAPCETLFGNVSWPMEAVCDTPFKCEETAKEIKDEAGPEKAFTYKTCVCKSGVPDENGGCGGWLSGASRILNPRMISIVVLCCLMFSNFVFFFSISS